MNNKLPPHSEFLAFAERMADASGKMLRAAADIKPEIDIKPDASFVTETDKAIETMMRNLIAETYPDHGIMGEEFENTNQDAEFVWVLDPIDGTAPFIAGIPVYGTLIGLAWQGDPFVGVIDHPATNDRWTGVANVFAKRNGKAVTTRKCDSLSTAFVTCSSPDFLDAAETLRFSTLRELVPYVQYGGSCYVYGLLASGRTDLSVDSGLDPFDVYASAAVIEGAGGVMTDWQGGAISLDWSGNVISAGDQACLDAAISVLNAPTG